MKLKYEYSPVLRNGATEKHGVGGRQDPQWGNSFVSQMRGVFPREHH